MRIRTTLGSLAPTAMLHGASLAIVAAAVLSISASAQAQGAPAAKAAPPPTADAAAQPPPPPPPPGYGQPPPGYQYPPGYGPPPGYPPPGYGPPPAYYGPPGEYPAVGPKKMSYSEGQPIPPGYRLETRMRRGLVIGGAVTFGSTYLISALTASVAVDAGGAEEFAPLFIPVAGPFVSIGTTEAQGTGTFLLVLDGIAQAGGVAMFIAGLATEEQYLLRNDVAKIKVAPIIGPTTFGFGIQGTM